MVAVRDVSRREVLALGGAAAVGYYSTRPSGGGGGSALPSFEGKSGARLESLRPVVGGSSVGIEPSDGIGTVAGGVRGPNGEEWVLTCRHVVDPEFPDSDREDVLGEALYQPRFEDSADPIGKVIDCGPSSGTDSTDWAVIELADGIEWSAAILGAGQPAAPTKPTVGDRLVMTGLRTGLHGVEVTSVGVSANWRGTLLYDLIEYRVDDESSTDTAGNSGGWVGAFDDSGTFRPAGIHAFESDGYRYAVPTSQCVEDPGASVESGGSLPPAPDADSYLEGALDTVGDSSLTAAVGNIGGASVTDRSVRVLDEDGNEIDATEVSLDALEDQRLTLSAPSEGAAVLDTGDETDGQVQP